MLLHRCKCGLLIPQELKACPDCEAAAVTSQTSRHMEYNTRRRNKKTAAFYVSSQWRKTRALALQLYDGLDLYAYYVQHVTAKQALSNYSITLNGNTITIETLSSGGTISIDGRTGTVTQNGANAFNVVDLWEFPKLQAGSNSITFSSSGANVKVKMQQRKQTQRKATRKLTQTQS